MRFGAGRPAAHPEIFEISPLTEAEVQAFKPAAEAENIIKKLRDSHHRIAHLFAMGYRPGEIVEITGYSLSRISNIRRSPAMDNLVELYRKEIVVPERQTEADHHFTQITRARNLAMGELIDRLEEEPDKFSPAQLLAITADGSDRTGYPKRSVAVNVNMDFASRLDRAIERTRKTIDGEFTESPSGEVAMSVGLSEPPQAALPTSFHRRV